MSDTAAVIDYLGEAWDKTDMTQSEFAALLRDEADFYEESPEEASSVLRVAMTHE